MDLENEEKAATGRTRKAIQRKPLQRGDSIGSQVAKEVVRIEQRLSQSEAKSKDISSWINDPTQPLIDPNLPLTPPSLPQDSTDEQGAIEGAEKENNDLTEDGSDLKSIQETQRIQTPVIQRSPPTPDHTPPKYVGYPQSALKARPTPPPTSRHPSSAAESFITAQEQLYSQESLALVSSGHTVRQESPRPSGMGLGLGIETSEGSVTPTVRTLRVSPNVRNVDDDDDDWNTRNIVMDDPFVARESVAVQATLDAQKSQRPNRSENQASQGSSTPEDFQASLDRGLPGDSLEIKDVVPSTVSSDENIPTEIRWPSDVLDTSSDRGFSQGDPPPNDAINSTSSSTENIPTEIRWPSDRKDTSVIHVDKKRLSELSSQSKIVQAVVVSTPPRRRQKLRHSSKNESLRAASSPVDSSNRSSLASNETKPRLHHHKTKITERGNRASVNSDSGISMGSDLRKKAEETLPASVIPQRRSSLKGSKRRLQHPGRLVDGRGRTNEQRPATALEGTKRHSIDVVTTRPRATSDAVPSNGIGEIRGRRLSIIAPAVPPRSSSLSAPTSRNGSRATSLTSTSLHRHNQQQQQQQQHSPPQRQQQQQIQLPQPEVPQVRPTSERHLSNYLSVTSEDKPTSDDQSGGKHRSLLATPFSMTSMQSSTPGPYEVNEATAINIYPHNNTSVLIVQQLPQRGSEQPKLSTSLSGNVRINLNGFNPSVGAAMHQNITSMPTRQPRDIPQFPPVVLIPPTPAQLDSAPPSRGRRSATSSNTSTGPFSMMRRALSARRYSESFVGPLTRSFPSRSNSMKRSNRTRIKPDEQSEQISGFWRPRAFWNDLSDDEDNKPRQGFIRTSIRGPDDITNNSIVRRFGSLRSKRTKPSPANESDGTYVSYGPPHRAHHVYPRYDSSTDGYDDVERKVGLISRMRNVPRPRPFASLQEAIRDMRQKRIEEQLEKQRERLRQNIGPVILQHDARPFY